MDPSPYAEELRQLLEQTALIVGRRASDNNAFRQELMELDVNLSFARLRLHGSRSQLEDELSQLRTELNARMVEYALEGRSLEERIRAKTEELREVDVEGAAKPAPGTRHKSVVQYDMAGYSTVVHRLEQNLGLESTRSLNQRIAGFANEALRAISTARRSVFASGGGDGAILAFDQASTAFDFAERFFALVRKHNDRIVDPILIPLYRRYFRMGIATGEIAWQPLGGGMFDMAGERIIDAVRFQDAGRPGELFVDESTFRRLTADQQAQFEQERLQVKGKREEVFTVYRSIFDPNAAEEAQQHGLWKPKS